MSRRRRHNAFTTIELLVAISILVILAGMVFVGFKVIGTGGKTRSTKAALESAKSMLAEIDASGGMAQVKDIYNLYTGTESAQRAFPPQTSSPTPVTAPNDGTLQRGHGNISTDTYSSSRAIRYTSPAIVLTQRVMGRLLSSPVNRTTISQIPAERLLHKPDGTPPSGGITFNYPTGNGQPNPAVLVDAWDNPIIYVPPAGLRGVFFADNPTVERVVTSTRVRGLYGSGTNPQSDTYKSFDPGATPFWASAGPDGDFTTGDDNLYSFE